MRIISFVFHNSRHVSTEISIVSWRCPLFIDFIVIHSVTFTYVLTAATRLLFCCTASGSNDPGAGIPLTERRLLFCSSDERDSLKPSSSASWIPVNRTTRSNYRVLTWLRDIVFRDSFFVFWSRVLTANAFSEKRLVSLSIFNTL